VILKIENDVLSMKLIRDESREQIDDDQDSESCSDDDESIEIADNSHTDQVIWVPVSPLEDYIYRPSILDNRSIYEFHAIAYRVKKSSSKAKTADPNISEEVNMDTVEDAGDFLKDDFLKTSHSDFQLEHSLYRTHRLAYRKRAAVPIPIGPKIPFVNDNSPQNIVAMRAKLALILFKPFRCIEADLIGSHGDWVNAFNKWDDMPSHVNDLLNNAYDYHAGRASAAKECNAKFGSPDDYIPDNDVEENEDLHDYSQFGNISNSEDDSRGIKY
jgi:hypothetical protein